MDKTEGIFKIKRKIFKFHTTRLKKTRQFAGVILKQLLEFLKAKPGQLQKNTSEIVSFAHNSLQTLRAGLKKDTHSKWDIRYPVS